MSLKDFPMLEKLSVSEKLELLEELWDSIRSEDSDIPISNEHKIELNKRLDSLSEDSLITLDALKKQVD